jgi:hypothetical protein
MQVVGLAALVFPLIFVSGCPLPLPPVPTPSPGLVDAGATDASPPADPFRGRILDCRLPVVAAQYAEASPRVGACLASPPPACLAGLLPSYAIDTVACLARDLGAAANSAVLAGTASGNDGTVAANARAFINIENLGFK